MEIQFTELTPCAQLNGEDLDETRELQAMLVEAREFITSFQWCRTITECYYGCGVGGVVAVFLFRIHAYQENVDEWLWTIVGDLPSAYLVTDLAPTPVRALETYIDEMQRWVKAVRNGTSVEDVIPVDVPPTISNAQNLENRLDVLRRTIIPRLIMGR